MPTSMSTSRSSLPAGRINLEVVVIQPDNLLAVFVPLDQVVDRLEHIPDASVCKDPSY